MMVLAAATVAVSQQAHATFITGSIDFSSIPGKTVKLLGANSFLLTTGLDFPTGPNAKVDGATGNFATESGSTATFSDFTFAAGASPLWVLTDGNFTFDLSPGAVVTRGAHFLTIDGVGMLHGKGFDDTPGSFILTTQGSPSSKTLKFSWSATSDATPVPEPSTFIAGALLALPFGAAALRSLRKSTVK